MWIRSQGKRNLVCADNIYIEPSSEVVNGKVTQGYFIRCSNNKWIFLLGVYSTEEKAKKVLDMIEEHIKNMYIGSGNYMGKPFQMPQDSKVE